MIISTCMDKDVSGVKTIQINWTAIIASVILGLFGVLGFFLVRTVDRIDTLETAVVSIQQDVSSIKISIEDIQKSQDGQFQILLKILESKTK